MTNFNDLIFAEGDEVRKAIHNHPRRKTAHVNLKDDEQLRGFLLVNKFLYSYADFPF